MNLVMVPFHDWKKCEREGFRTRDGHFMQEFGRHQDVDKLLVINRPVSLAEMLLLRKGRRVKNSRLVAETKEAILSQVAPNTYTLDITLPDIVGPLLMRRGWIPTAFGKTRVLKAVRFALSQLDMAQDYAIFLSAPLSVPLVKRLNPPVFMLDAQDNLLKHAQYRDVPNLAQYYEYCIANADLLSANSTETTAWFREQRPDSFHVPNGVDPTILDPQRDWPRPAELESIPRPIVGYAGKMQEMVDIELLLHVITQLPEVSFVFIGQQLDPEWVKPLWRLANVHYLGDQHYERLPSFLAAFDICIIAYSQSRQHGGDPIKLYEYLAMGKPVVTTRVGNVAEFEDFPQVAVVQSSDEFTDCLRLFLYKLQRGEQIPCRPLPVSTFWQTKADHIVQLLLKKTARKSRRKSTTGE